MTITCIYPEDMSILENKLIDTLTDIAIQKFTSEEIDLIVDGFRPKYDDFKEICDKYLFDCNYDGYSRAISKLKN